MRCSAGSRLMDEGGMGGASRLHQTACARRLETHGTRDKPFVVLQGWRLALPGVVSPPLQRHGRSHSGAAPNGDVTESTEYGAATEHKQPSMCTRVCRLYGEWGCPLKPQERSRCARHVDRADRRAARDAPRAPVITIDPRAIRVLRSIRSGQVAVWLSRGE